MKVLSGPTILIGEDVSRESFGKSIFEAIRKKNGDKVFMVDPITKQELNYSTLLESTVKLAILFQKLGLEKNDVITIISENNLQYFVPLLAGLYIGTPVNCANPNYTENDLMHCFSITKPKVVVCSKKCLEKMENLQKNLSYIKHILVLDEETLENSVENFCKRLVKNEEVARFRPDEFDPKTTCALILFSSGTTGLAKGVMLSHHNLRSSFVGIFDERYVDMNLKTVTVGLLPFFHMFGVLVVLAIILCEGKIVVLDKFKPEQFLQTIQDQKITVLFVVPPLLLFLAKSPIVDKYNLESLEDVLCGAAPSGKDVEQSVEKRLKQIKIRQIYGLTETAGAVCVTLKHEKKYGSVGKLLPGVQLKVCDSETKQVLSVNQPGEICVKADGIMMGYMGNPGETQITIDSGGYLCTGDVGYYDEQGFVYIVDRIKELIKYKGFQVPPAQLEDLLLKHQAVKDAAVVGKPDERAGELPVAFVVKQLDAKVNEANLVDYIAEFVSTEKQLHGGVVFVDEIPKNPSGKILRRVLREKFIAS